MGVLRVQGNKGQLQDPSRDGAAARRVKLGTASRSSLVPFARRWKLIHACSTALGTWRLVSGIVRKTFDADRRSGEMEEQASQPPGQSSRLRDGRLSPLHPPSPGRPKRLQATQRGFGFVSRRDQGTNPSHTGSEEGPARRLHRPCKSGRLNITTCWSHTHHTLLFLTGPLPQWRPLICPHPPSP
jgi:hypothetical protein